MKRDAIRFFMICLVTIIIVSDGQGDQQKEQIEQVQSYSSIDSVTHYLYKAITFEAEQVPDWALFRSLFIPDARLARVTKEGVNEWDVEGFISNFQERIEKATITSFYEGEIKRKIHVYGGIAQVLSVYTKGVNQKDKEKLIRGVNLIQMIYHDGRWWIVSLIWQDEQPDLPIPKKLTRK